MSTQRDGRLRGEKLQDRPILVAEAPAAPRTPDHQRSEGPIGNGERREDDRTDRSQPDHWLVDSGILRGVLQVEHLLGAHHLIGHRSSPFKFHSLDLGGLTVGCANHQQVGPAVSRHKDAG